VFDIEQSRLLSELDLLDIVSLSPDGKRLLTGRDTFRLWDATQKRELPLPQLQSLPWYGRKAGTKGRTLYSKRMMEEPSAPVIAPDWSCFVLALAPPTDDRPPAGTRLLYWSIPKPLDLDEAK